MLVKRMIRKAFQFLGHDIVKYSTSFDDSAISMAGALFRCKSRGVSACTVFDIGASNGSWSEICMRYFAMAEYVLIEAQKVHERSLEKFCKAHSNCRAVMAAAGAEVGTCNFDSSEPFSGAVVEGPFKDGVVSVPSTTIDFTRESMQLRPPYIVKLDTHGYEVPILEGASRTLADTSLLVVEAYNFRISEHSLKFFELCSWLEKKGFCPIDVADVLLRPRDHAFWQMDMFFVPSDSPSFAYDSYL